MCETERHLWAFIIQLLNSHLFRFNLPIYYRVPFPLFTEFHRFLMHLKRIKCPASISSLSHLQISWIYWSHSVFLSFCFIYFWRRHSFTRIPFWLFLRSIPLILAFLSFFSDSLIPSKAESGRSVGLVVGRSAHSGPFPNHSVSTQTIVFLHFFHTLPQWSHH